MSSKIDISNINVPASWKTLDLSKLRGTIMVIGGVNTGKTTFAYYLISELRKIERNVAFLDGDPGQSNLGPPSTMSLMYPASETGENVYPNVWHSFVGSISPNGHMLQCLVSVKRLADFIKTLDVDAVIFDTTGLIDPKQGGLALKLAKIELLRPTTLIALQKNDELSSIVLPFRKSNWINVEVIKPSEFVRIRDKLQRKEYRASKYREYFSSSTIIELDWRNYSIIPTPSFAINRLIALEDRYGFMSALGIILSIHGDNKKILIKVPAKSLEGIETIRLGNILVNPETYEDYLL